MRADLSLAQIDVISLNSKLGILQRFLSEGLRVCIGDVDANGKRKTTTSPTVVNQAFTITHTLRTKPDFYFYFPWSGAAVVGSTENEQKTWDERIITVHSSIASTAFTFLIASLK